jgi:thiamine kinase-like enzyme
MKNFVKFSFFPFLLFLTRLRVLFYKKSAEAMIKKNLLIKSGLSTKEVGGGFSGNLIYLSTDGKNKYIVKFFKNKERGAREIYNSQIASKEGIGSRVYFSDPSKGRLVMEYLDCKELSKEGLKSTQICIDLAHLLQKIHKGEPFGNFEFNPFKNVEQDGHLNKFKGSQIIPLDKIEDIVNCIQKVLMPTLEKVPCHNDLHYKNLIFLENGIKAIDYAWAGQNDPYFDIAFVAISPFVYSNPLHEEVLFKTYLGHIPSEREKAKLYLMKQIALIRSALNALNGASLDDISQHPAVETYTLQKINEEMVDRKFDLHNLNHDLIFLKVLLNQFLKNAKSEEFKMAIKLLSDHD